VRLTPSAPKLRSTGGGPLSGTEVELAMKLASVVAAGAVMAVALPALAQSAPPTSNEAAAQAAPATVVEDVTVTATTRRTISEFVRDVSEESRGGRLARWNRTICPANIGLQRRYAEYMNERMAAVARDAGLKVARPGCKPDILIIVTPDVAAVLAELEGDSNGILTERRWSDERTSHGGSQSLEAFMQSEKPVRWWHVSETVSAEGAPVGDNVRMRSSGSRVRSTVREDFMAVIVIVDANKAKGVTYQALADYVAMVSLAQLNPNVNASQVPTVLNIFDDVAAGRPPAAGLTEWDKRYLKTLYGMRADTADGRRQRGRIVRGVETRDN